jgi:transcriptional regulator
MYNYPHYKEEDILQVVQFMRDNPFATMIGCNSGRIEATQIPVMLDERDGRIFISGHMSRKSDHGKAFAVNPGILMLFTGTHSYVSGTWYSGNPQQASTWNYISVHVRGRLQFTDEDGLIGILKKLTLHFENGDTSSSTIYDNLPHEYRSKLIKAIVGFEFEVTELDNVYKLSQNRDEKSYDNIVVELDKRGGDAKEIGQLMKDRKEKVFQSSTDKSS